MSDIIICKTCEGKKIVKLEEKIDICPTCKGEGVIKEEINVKKKLLFG